MRCAALGFALVLALAACGTTDPCDGTSTCVALHVASPTIHRIDQLELDLLFGTVHSTVTTQDGSHTTALPAETAIVLDLSAPVTLGVVAAGKLSGTVLGTGAGQVAIAPGHHASIELELAPPEACVAASLYCGGDKVAGDPMTLYECDAGGVPQARGTCTYGCIIEPGNDDACRGGGGTCVTGGHYCGGDKLDGDPGTLYVCSAGVGTSPMRCPNGCAVVPGSDDMCR